MGRHAFILACNFLLIQFLTLLSLTQCKIPAIIVFGDSSVDTGNNNGIATLLKSNIRPYGRDFFGGIPSGRFSNGRLPPDFISEALGIKPAIPAYLDPKYTIQDFATGVCFASAGTGYDTATSAVLNVIPMWKELSNFNEYQRKLRGYLGEEKANETLSEALYYISLGTNDFLENYFVLPKRKQQFSVSQYVDFLVGLAEKFIRKIYDLGGRKIFQAGLIPIGCKPLERAKNLKEPRSCDKDVNNATLEFNKKLEIIIERLKKELPGTQMLYSDAYDLINDMIIRPGSYGFEVAEKSCCATGTFEMGYVCNRANPFTCKDADKYVFWDAFHPTDKVNRITAEHLLVKLRENFH